MTKFNLLYFLSFLMIVLLLTACSEKTKHQNINSESSKQSSSASIGWYVIKKESQKGLVVNPIPNDYSSTGGIKEFYEAIWVSNFPEDVQVGQKVEIIFEGEMATSYPGQARAKKVSVLPNKKPDKSAKLTEEQVLREAIKSKEAAEIRVFIPKEISFDEKSKLWTIRFIDGTLSDKQKEERSLQIQDK
jgi:hypothetical protein